MAEFLILLFENENEEEIQAFDICFGNAPMDDLVKEKLNLDFDENGKIALTGNVDFLLVDRILQNEIFHSQPPKSFNRSDFDKIIAPINNLKLMMLLQLLLTCTLKQLKLI